MRSISLLVILAMAWLSCRYAPAQDSAAEPIATRQKSFSIPFTVDEQVGPPAEVQLYVSTNRGAEWNLFDRQLPDKKAFAFLAPRDGEYWFALKTIDQNRRPQPPGPARPELKVLVDTLPPRIEFSAQANDVGQVVASWRVFDEHLIGQSLQVEYQSVGHAGAAAWQPVAVELPRDGAIRTSLSGNTSWPPPLDASAINVRARIRDSAGNIEVVNRRVALPHVPLAERRQPPMAKPSTQPPVDLFARSPSQGTVGQKWLADNDAGAFPDSIPPSPSQIAAQNTHRPDAAPGQAPVRLPPAPPATNQLVSTSNQSYAATPFKPLSLGQRPRPTRSNRFSLQYDVESVGPEGVAGVVFWMTRDNGRTWSRWGDDPDKQSPHIIEVDEDGVYGFRIVVSGINGLAGKSPRDGDPPDIVIGVDTTKPSARIVSAPFGTGSQVGHLLINWQAHDDQLAARPVKLLFSENAAGPWSAIADELPNTGQYAWLVDPRSTRQVFLRLEVRDEAGNVQVDQLSRPINVAAMIPSGHIRGFEPVE